MRMTAKGRGKGEAKLPSKESNMETSIVKGTASSTHETFKTFCIRFVRLNGILFTRTRYLVLNITASLLQSIKLYEVAAYMTFFLQFGNICRGSHIGQQLSE